MAEELHGFESKNAVPCIFGFLCMLRLHGHPPQRAFRFASAIPPSLRSLGGWAGWRGSPGQTHIRRGERGIQTTQKSSDDKGSHRPQVTRDAAEAGASSGLAGPCLPAGAAAPLRMPQPQPQAAG